MKKTIDTIAVVMGILLFILMDCSKLKDNPKLSMPRANLQRTGVYNTRGVHELGGLKWEFKIEGEIVSSSAIISNGVIYCGASDGYLHAVESNTGQEKWRFKTEGTLLSDPTVVDGIVYFGSNDGYLYAVDINTRQEKWKFKTEDRVASSPAISDGVAYFGSYNRLYAVDINTGYEKWVFETDGRLRGFPAIQEGLIYFGTSTECSSSFYALDKRTGHEKWRFKLEVLISGCSSPAISDGTVCFMTTDHYLNLRVFQQLLAIDSNTGQEKWRFKKGSFSDPAIYNGIVYLGSSDGCYAIDISTGQEKWRFKTGQYVSSPSIADGIVYFGAEDSCLYAIDANTGHEKWRFRIDARQVCSPTLADGVVYFQSGLDVWELSTNRGGILYALESRKLYTNNLQRHKKHETAIVDENRQIDSTTTIPSVYQGSLFLNNSYGEKKVDIYVTVFEKDHKINQILLKVYNYQGIYNFLAYAPEIDFPRYPDKPYPQCGLITCLPLELGSDLPAALKKPLLYPNTWKEYVFHYGPDRCTERPQEFPSISDIQSGKAKLCIRLDGHAFTIDNLETLSQR